jgi:hypothetical protein
LIKLLFLVIFSLNLIALEAIKIEPDDFVQDNKFQILDSKVINIGVMNGIAFKEISDIAYDKRNDILYALSDKGLLYHLKLVIKDNKIEKLIPIKAYGLKDKNRRRLLRRRRDSEGMALVYENGKTNILISFERNAKIIKFSNKGILIDELKLSPKLVKRSAYRGANRMLESLTLHPKYGVLTTPERPLYSTKDGYHNIYTQKSILCSYKKDDDMSITELEIDDDENLIILERKFSFFDFTFKVKIKKVYINDVKSSICKADTLVSMDSGKGWNIDNFEGLSYYDKNTYLMVSDSNNNKFEKTILTLFKINP